MYNNDQPEKKKKNMYNFISKQKDHWTSFHCTVRAVIHRGMSRIPPQNIQRGCKSRDLNYSNKSFQARPDEGLPLIQRQGPVW